MNKKIVVFLTLALTMLLFVACDSPEENNDTNGNYNGGNEQNGNNAEANESVTINWVSGPQSGITYPFGVAVTQLLERVVPGANTNVGEGASISNAQNVNDNDAQMAHTQGDVLYSGINGEEPFSEELTTVQTFGRVMDFEFQFVVTSDLGVTSFEEIRENQVPLRIVVGERGFAGEQLTRRVLEAYDITYEDIESWGGEINYLPYTEGGQQIQNEHANAMAIQSGAPTPVLQETMYSRDLTFLPIDENIIEELSEKYGLVHGEITPEYYESIENTVPTVAAAMQLIVHEDVPEDLVYTLTKNLFDEEFKTELGSINSRLSDITPEYSGSGLVGPLHPGAERFYKEEGVIE